MSITRKPLSRIRVRHFRLWLILSVCTTGLLVAYFWNAFFQNHAQMVPDFGGIYTESTIGQIHNLNPLASRRSPFDRDLEALLFAGLLAYDPLTGEVGPGLADFQISDQGRNYEVTLHEDLRFSDGSEIDVSDVLFTFETLLKNPNLRNSDLREGFHYVDISALDNRTVSFKLPEPNVFFPHLLTTPILPQTYFKNALIEELEDPGFPFNQNPVGAGPYILKNIVTEDEGLTRIFLKRNPFYYQGKPYLDQIVFYLYQSAEQAIVNHKWPTSFTRLSLAQVEKLQPHLFGEYKDYKFLLPQYTGLFFNLDAPSMQKPSLREALSQSLKPNSFLESGWEWITSPFFERQISGSKGVVPDFKQARQTLRDNGYPYRKIREIRTFPETEDLVELKLITSTSPAVYSRFAQNIKALWESELDIAIDLEVLKPQDFQESLTKRDYDMVLFGQNLHQNPDGLSVWHSTQSGDVNLSNITREDIDFLIEEIRVSGSQGDYEILQQKLDEVIPALIFGTPQHQILVQNQLKGFPQNIPLWRSLSHRFSDVHLWHLETTLDWNLPEGSSKIWHFIQWFFS